MNSKYYEHIEDFLRDDSFKNWVTQQNAQDYEEWEVWIKHNPKKRALVEEAKSILIGPQFKKEYLKPAEVKLEWKKLDNRINKQSKKKPRPSKHRYILGIAASLLLLISIGYYWIDQPTIAAETIHKTAYGEQLVVKLPDGTEVALNANSILKYQNDNPRKVWLSGEAYFDVLKKPSTKAKFWVYTPDLVVEVFGTQFNVNSKKSQTEVLLEEGNINLKLKNGVQKNMEVGDLLVFSAKENKILQEAKVSKTAVHTSWKQGTLIFENISLAEAMKEIESTYGLEVIFKKEHTAKRKIHLAVPTKNLEICILAFEKALGITIERKENQLMIL